MTDDPHSQRYFTDARDHWWNQDYLALLARRLGVDRARDVLDVGAGQGHFGRAWAPHLAPGFAMVGVDREARSLAVAAARAAVEAAGTFRYQVADAAALPFADGSFDLVMCQTLLIHVPDPAVVVAEMVRVCRPGGLVLAVEPNNLGGLQRIGARGPDGDLALALVTTRFHLVVARGKHALGLGWNDLGVQLPRWFAGLRDVQWFGNDRAWAMVPPYATAQEQAEIADLQRDVREGVYGWPRDEARRYYLAGGGSEAAFEEDYAALLAGQADDLRRVMSGAWVELTAATMLVVAGRKPT
jgi:SAM-dependent methyltransferase